MNKDFADFQKYFKEYQKLFGLNGYKVYFKHEELDGSFASVKVNIGDMVATVRLNSKLSDIARPHKDIRSSAKHEALHLLIGRLELNGHYRYVAEDEIYESSEELVHKLEGLIR